MACLLVSAHPDRWVWLCHFLLTAQPTTGYQQEFLGGSGELGVERFQRLEGGRVRVTVEQSAGHGRQH